MALLLVAGNRRRHNAPRIFRDRQNPLDYMDDTEIVRKYRLDRNTIFDLCNELQELLRRPTHRTQSLPVSLQVSLALRFFASGSFQSVIADGHGVSVHSVSRSIHAVAYELTQRINHYVKFPITNAERTTIKQEFYNIDMFPNVIGAIDGTFIPIKTPTDDEYLYVTRKGFHAINVQGICDANNLFLDLVVRWPGSTHDAFMWSNSNVARYLEEQNNLNSWLLGDSAYPLRPHLLTPVQRPISAAEHRYNSAHKKTRCTIERTFGLWKMRFRCLDKSAGYLMYSPVRCVNIICAAGVLHNICVMQRIPLNDNEQENYGGASNDDDDNDGGDDDENEDGRDRQVDGCVVRNTLILETFERR